MRTFLLILVALLGSERFRTREACHAFLQRHAGLAAEVLRIGGRSGCPETACRSRNLLRTWFLEDPRRLEAEVEGLKPEGWTLWPWLVEKDDSGQWGYTSAAQERASGFSGRGTPNHQPEFMAWVEAMREKLTLMVMDDEPTEELLRSAVRLQTQWCLENKVPLPLKKVP